MMLISNQFEVLRFEIKYTGHGWIDPQCGQRIACASQLLLNTIKLIVVDVSVADGVNKVTYL